MASTVLRCCLLPMLGPGLTLCPRAFCPWRPAACGWTRAPLTVFIQQFFMDVKVRNKQGCGACTLGNVLWWCPSATASKAHAEREH